MARSPDESPTTPPSAAASPLVCPHCHGGLERSPAGLGCPRCGRAYPCGDDGIADFSGGESFDAFVGPETLSDAERVGLENERAGAAARVEDFYAPLVLAHRPPSGRPLRALDSGCGTGLSVDLLELVGIEAWGNDLSRLRRWQWRERRRRDRLVMADSRRLPFPDGYFDCVISSGVIEHVGVAEVGRPRYRVRPLPTRDAERVEFLGELLRVTAGGGTLFLDFPNGAFPIDFWHGDRPGGARFHRPAEGFLPTIGDVRRYTAGLGSYRVRPLSPLHRLRMRQVGGHWYGRLLKLPMRLLLRLMTLGPLRPLAGSALNPYLVLAIRREG